ncbi:ubiquitin carboxyl-terminal hydrolase 31-like [Brevipalpus obovatus]|uniref:ubiquitin carboxyl-terminal hydrolase 31-like n=1 Tax=Brevipalpus obovatus TaxID=246614 RepID=UPI003D9EAAAC
MVRESYPTSTANGGGYAPLLDKELQCSSSSNSNVNQNDGKNNYRTKKSKQKVSSSLNPGRSNSLMTNQPRRSVNDRTEPPPVKFGTVSRLFCALFSIFNNNYDLNDGSSRHSNRRHSTRSSRIKGPLAICGIKNHGNTCFMNATFQCLLYTDPLAEYFVMNRYKMDLIKYSQSHSRSSFRNQGSSGQVTCQSALLFKSLWTGTYSYDISSKFKTIVARNCQKYEGNEQHDAQEFLLWLLNTLHEDLNVSVPRKNKKSKSHSISWDRMNGHVNEGSPNTSRLDNSFIRDLFQAQLHSSLVCQSCFNVSNTFEPYLCLSLPIPAETSITLALNVLNWGSLPFKRNMLITLDCCSSIGDIRAKVSHLSEVPEKQLVLLLRDDERGIKELSNDLALIQDVFEGGEIIEAIEKPNLPSFTVNIVLIWANRVGIGTNNKIFGPLFCSEIPRDASFKEIQANMMKTMKPILRDSCDLAVLNDSILFNLRIADTSSKLYLSEDDDLPLLTLIVDEALGLCDESTNRTPLHLKLVVEWDLDLRQTLLIEDGDLMSPWDQYSDPLGALDKNQLKVALTDCFDQYFHEERLGEDNAWMCPACRRRQQCIKKLNLCSTPNVFIIHLKRFHQASSSRRTKLSTLVSFPLTGLDVNPYLCNKGSSSAGDDMSHVSTSGATSRTDSSAFIVQPWKKCNRHSITSCPEDNFYELYAVCNHHGTMQAGHYTAYCRNMVDGKWYSFDDQKVSSIPERSVVTKDAYMLFYQRKTLVEKNSNNTSNSSSSLQKISVNSHKSRKKFLSSSHNGTIACSEQSNWSSQMGSKTLPTDCLGNSRSYRGNSLPRVSSRSQQSDSSPSSPILLDGSRKISDQSNTKSRIFSTLPSRKSASKSLEKSLHHHTPASPTNTSLSPKQQPVLASRNSSGKPKVLSSFRASLLSPARDLLDSNTKIASKNSPTLDDYIESNSSDDIEQSDDSSKSPTNRENNRFFTVTSV